MRLKEYQLVLAVMITPLLVLWGCKSKTALSPGGVTKLSVSVPLPANLTASLLGADSNEILYVVSGSGVAPVTGVYGPFSTPHSSGAVAFTINDIPTAPNQVLALQLNDASTHQALAIGAAGLGSGAGLVTIELGSVARSCYVVSMPLASCSQNRDEEFNFQEYGYDYGEYTSISSGNCCDQEDSDIAFVNENCGGAYDLVDGWTGFETSIAYLGNGNYVNFAYVPPDSSFFVDSIHAKLAAGVPDTDLQVNDIFCVKINGGTAPGHAWLQITDTGNTLTGPTFSYRMNPTVPFYEYYQTSADSEAGSAPCTLIADWDLPTNTLTSVLNVRHAGH